MSEKKINIWRWLPSLYYTEGIPYIIVMTLSVIMYKRLGISNTDIALYTSWLYLPWVIKPLWSPVVDILKTKRYWIVLMQLLIGAGLAGVAFTIPTSSFFQYTLAFFWLLAFSSATHDIAADGFYMLALNSNEQTFYVGIRSTFYRIAMLTGQGLIVIIAGHFETTSGLEPLEIKVNARNNIELEHNITLPEYTNVKSTTEELKFISVSELNLSTENIDKQIYDSLLAVVHNSNVQNNFYEKEEQITQEPSWWQKNVSIKLKAILKERFNKEPVKTGNRVGNVGIVAFKLNREIAKDKDIILNFGQKDGDKSIMLVEGVRFVFNRENQDKTAYALIQLDPKLNSTKTAVFLGRSGNITFAWTISFGILAILFFAFFIYHKFMLPYPASDVKHENGEGRGFFKEFIHTFVLYFNKKEIWVILGFLLLYRLSESQLIKLAAPFLIDSREAGGLGITTGDLGLLYGTIGMIALTLGGILGGILAARKGLKYWLWLMVLIMNIPHLAYVYLSFAMPTSLIAIGTAVAIEQFGYGFGFTAYMLYMIYISEGKYKTAHFAISTGFMALGMMLPGMLSGWLQEIIGYQNFFVWVLICTLPIMAIIPFVKVDSKFGVNDKSEK